MEGWLNKKEVGEYLGGKSPRTVDRWIAKRIIPQGKRGSRPFPAAGRSGGRVMIKGSGKLNKETYESLLKQGISAEDIRKGEKNLRLVAHQTPGAKEYGLSWAMQLHFEGKLRWVAFPMECWVGVLRDEEDDEE